MKSQINFKIKTKIKINKTIKPIKQINLILVLVSSKSKIKIEENIKKETIIEIKNKTFTKIKNYQNNKLFNHLKMNHQKVKSLIGNMI